MLGVCTGVPRSRGTINLCRHSKSTLNNNNNDVRKTHRGWLLAGVGRMKINTLPVFDDDDDDDDRTEM